MRRPAVSVVMPCYNHSVFIKASVGSILDQTHAIAELIIVDDCSNDNSREVISSLAAQDARIKPLFHERNCGASESRNDGIQTATGDYICFCDSDDLWMRDKIAVQLALLEGNPGYDVAYSDAEIIDEAGCSDGRRFSDRYPVPDKPSGNLFHELCLRNFINIQTVMIRSECLREGVLFDPRIRWVEDWLFWITLSKSHQFVYCSDALARYRVHTRSTNKTQRRGYHVNRFKVFHHIVRSGYDLPDSRRSQICYHMGCCLRALGKHRPSRRLFAQAVITAAHSLSALPCCARPLVRLAQLWRISSSL